MSTLEPKPGFDWDAVTWGKPDEPPGDRCSYCAAPIDEDAVPLITWKDDRHAAQFCDHCMVRWWGFAPRSSYDEDDDYG